MKYNWKLSTFYIILTWIVAILLLLFVVSKAKAKQNDNVCPHGGLWSEHQDPEDWNGAVETAVEYCWKGGSENSNCRGYLYNSNNPSDYPLEGEHVCDLSHWSYRLGSVTSPSPSQSPTEFPSATPTVTPTESPITSDTPTPTPISECRDCVTPTSTPSPTATATQTPTTTPQESTQPTQTPSPTNNPQWEEIKKNEGEVFGPRK